MCYFLAFFVPVAYTCISMCTFQISFTNRTYLQTISCKDMYALWKKNILHRCILASYVVLCTYCTYLLHSGKVYRGRLVWKHHAFSLIHVTLLWVVFSCFCIWYFYCNSGKGISFTLRVTLFMVNTYIVPDCVTNLRIHFMCFTHASYF